MTDPFFTINVTGLEEVQKKLAKLPPAVKGEVEIAVGNYLLNILTNEEIPTYKHVSRARAYPETGDGFFSNKQRRWFFWAVKHGMIDFPYRRRGKHGGVASEWHIIRKGDNLTLENHDKAAVFLYDNQRQARQLGMVGWLKISEILMWRTKNIDGVINRAAKKAIQKAGLS